MKSLPAEVTELIFQHLPTSSLYNYLTLSKAIHPVIKAAITRDIDFTESHLAAFMRCIALQDAHTRRRTFESVKSIVSKVGRPRRSGFEYDPPESELLIALLKETRLTSLKLNTGALAMKGVMEIASAIDTSHLQVLELDGNCSFDLFYNLARKGLPKLRDLTMSVEEETELPPDMRDVLYISAIPTLRNLQLSFEATHLSQMQWQLDVLQAICAAHTPGTLSIDAEVDQLREETSSWQLLNNAVGPHVKTIHFYSDDFPIGTISMDEAFSNVETFRCNTGQLDFDQFTMPPSVREIEFNLIRTNLESPASEDNLLRLASLRNLRSLTIICEAVAPDAFLSYARLNTTCEQKGIDFSIVGV